MKESVDKSPIEQAAEDYALEFLPPEEKWDEDNEIEYNVLKSAFIAGANWSPGKGDAEEFLKHIFDPLIYALRCRQGFLKEEVIGSMELFANQFKSANASEPDELIALRRWKKEAMAVMPDFQEIGKLLEVPLGQPIHDKIIPGIKKLIEGSTPSEPTKEETK